MKLFYQSLFLLFTVTCTVHGQSISTDPKAGHPVKVTPPSPQAAALGKYGEIPTQLYTGVPSIDIPLYTVATPKIQFSISLSYHSSGVKVEEIASTVGLGWTLNAGGVITRSVVGQADGGNGGFATATTQTKMTQYKNQTMSVAVRENFEKDVVDGLIDTEPDQFYYNFMGRSGKLVYDNTGSMKLVDHQDIGVSITAAGFVLTDASGIRYTFETQESTTSLSNCNGSQTPSEEFITAWYLTRIDPVVGRAVTFAYAESFASIFSGLTETDARPQTFNSCGGGSSTTQLCRNRINGNYKRISQISFENGTVDFAYSSRADFNAMQKLDGLMVRDQNNQIIKSFGFTYGYSTPALRSFLDKVEETTSAINAPVHDFTYTDRNALPVYGSYQQDLWGYYNSNAQNTLIPFTTIPSNYQGRTVWADRGADPAKATIGMLERITYPTQGYTRFYFEGHDYGYNFVSPVDNGGQKYREAGGVRIKRLVNYNLDNSLISEREFVYREAIDPDRSSGMLVQDPVFGYAYSTATFTSSGSGGSTQTTCGSYNLSSTSHSYLGATNGNHVTYKEVMEYYAADRQTRGKTVHSFTSHFDYPDGQPANMLPFEPNISKEYLRGKPLERQDFETVSGTNFLLRSQNNKVYSPTTIQEVEGLKIRYSARNIYIFTPGTSVADSIKFIESVKPNSVANGTGSYVGTYGTSQFAFYRIPVTWMYVNKEIDTQSETTGTVVNESFYAYNPQHLQLTELRTLRSGPDNEKLARYTYPRDYNVPTGSISNEALAIRSMQAGHIDNAIVEERHYEKVNGTLRLTAAVQTDYEVSGFGLPFRVRRYVPESGISNWNDSYIDGSGNFIRDGRLKEQFAYEQYDDFGNLQQLRQKSGLVSSYVWGYGGRYPIIEAVNVDYPSLAGINGNLANLSNEGDIVNATNQLRAAFPQAHFTNFTHSPLIGVTAVNAPNRLRTGYIYDGLRRLQSMTDNQSQVTDHFLYNYATGVPVSATQSPPTNPSKQ